MSGRQRYIKVQVEILDGLKGWDRILTGLCLSMGRSFPNGVTWNEKSRKRDVQHR